MKSQLAVAILISAISAVGQTSSPPACTSAKPSSTDTIHGSGCIVPGVEAGCLALKDLATGKNYSVHFEGLAPGVGTAIKFNGVPDKDVDFCMGPNTVKVTNCTVIRYPCKPPSAAVHSLQSKPTTPPPTKVIADDAKIEGCTDWSATYDLNHGRPGTLAVSGKCVVQGDVTLTLVPRRPQGINPKIDVFDLVMSWPSTGVRPQDMLSKPFSYSRKTSTLYSSVTIGSKKTIKVVVSQLPGN
jgi:hypothetical protein